MFDLSILLAVHMKCPNDGSSRTLTSLTRSYRFLLRACSRQSSLAAGQKLHAVILTSGAATSPNTYLFNALLHMYAACGGASCARHMFNQIPNSHKDTVDWTTLISCYAANSMPQKAINLFFEMLRLNLRPDEVTMVCFFGSCTQLGDAVLGAQGHGLMIKWAFGFSVKTCNSVMNMYVKCGLMGDARRIFKEMSERSVVSWTVILDGVINWEGLRNAQQMFDEMPGRNEVAWTIMITGYIERGFSKEGFQLLAEMVFNCGIWLNYITLCSLLSASIQCGDLIMGRWTHVYALKTKEKELNIMVSTALIDMYAKCGKIKSALRIFEKMPYRNTVAWNVMLSGLAMHGEVGLLLNIFPQMVEEAKPDDLTFISILTACSHSGLVDLGFYYFYRLESVYGIEPKMEHYACMVDLLGRAGQLEEAENLVRKMPILPNEFVLGSLLGSCNTHGQFHLGDKILRELIKITPHNTRYHILLSNMYALDGKREKANCLREALKRKGIRKVPGMSSIHVKGQVHWFSAGDKSHIQTREIYEKLDEMVQRLRLVGYVPNTASQIISGFVGGESDETVEEEREQALFSHSERLAICFGLISTKEGVALYIFKNLRMCLDCHSAIKMVSDIYRREIIVRDRSRFHSFKHGSCSCADYW